MPYLCKECGEKHRFTATGYNTGTCNYTEDADYIIDEDGEIIEEIETSDIDYSGYNEEEQEISDCSAVYCDSCGEEADHVTKEEWDSFKLKKKVEKKPKKKTFRVEYV